MLLLMRLTHLILGVLGPGLGLDHPLLQFGQLKMREKKISQTLLTTFRGFLSFPSRFFRNIVESVNYFFQRGFFRVEEICPEAKKNWE